MTEGGQLVDHGNGREVILRLRGVRTQLDRKSTRLNSSH